MLVKGAPDENYLIPFQREVDLPVGIPNAGGVSPMHTPQDLCASPTLAGTVPTSGLPQANSPTEQGEQHISCLALPRFVAVWRVLWSVHPRLSAIKFGKFTNFSQFFIDIEKYLPYSTYLVSYGIGFPFGMNFLHFETRLETETPSVTCIIPVLFLWCSTRDCQVFT